MTAEQVRARRLRYQPRVHLDENPELARVLDAIGGGAFSPSEPGLFRPIVDSLVHHDEYMLLADYASYVECQERVAKAYRDPALWTKMSILNVANMGKFSTDRTIREYAEEIWGVKSVSAD